MATSTWWLILAVIVLMALVVRVSKPVKNTLQVMAEQLMAEIDTTYPGKYPGLSERVREVKPYPRETMLRHRPGLPPRVRKGWYDRANGIVYVATTTPQGTPLPDSLIAGILTHEMAHAAVANGHHDTEWRVVYEEFLKIATVGLGWDVAMARSSCSLYGLCDRDQCVKCTWK